MLRLIFQFELYSENRHDKNLFTMKFVKLQGILNSLKIGCACGRDFKIAIIK